MYVVNLQCHDRCDTAGRLKRVYVRFEWMDPPGILWKMDDVTAVDNRLKVSILTQNEIQICSNRFYPPVCRWIYRHVTRVKFAKNEFGMYKMELLERHEGQDRQIQHAYLHCTDAPQRDLVILREDTINDIIWQWHNCLYWNFRRSADETFEGSMQLLPNAKYRNTKVLATLPLRKTVTFARDTKSC
jgi:hypothetical protein